MKLALSLFFVAILIFPSVVNAVNFTLFPGTRPVTAPFPGGGRFIEDSVPITRREISPGEFDADAVVSSICANDTDAAQWRPNQSLANNSGAIMISSGCNNANNANKLSAGWLWNSTNLVGYNLSNSTQRNGNWSFRFVLRSGQATSATESLLARVSIVRNIGGTLTLIKSLFARRVTGSATADAGLSQGLLGWRDTDYIITHPTSTATDTQFNFEIGPTNESYLFTHGDAFYIELGFGNADDTTDRTLTLIYNFSQTNITTPNFVPVSLDSNSSFTINKVIMLTNETTIFTGNCTVNDGNATVDIRIQDNRTGSFTNSSTLLTAAVFVNVTNYTVPNLRGSSSNFNFLVNATALGNYSFRTQCESDATFQQQVNSSDDPNALIVQVPGYLNVSLIQPESGVAANVIQNRTFLIVANVTCMGGSFAVCGQVNGTARYNHTGAEPLAQINTTSGDRPFWTETGNQSCGFLNNSDTCSLNWSVNASGTVGIVRKAGVLFSSNITRVIQNTTANSTISITGCGADFSLQWNGISFGTLTPSTTQNSAPGNSNSLYNITVNPASCDIDLYIRGTDLTNSSIASRITVNNITWSNSTNSYATSVNLSSGNVAIRKNVPPLTNVTTWYWINVPPVLASLYNGTITITGVRAGDPP